MNPIERRLPHDPKCEQCSEQVHLIRDAESGKWYCRYHWDDLMHARAQAELGNWVPAPNELRSEPDPPAHR